MKVVFLHIPKTAGQSVRAMLYDAFGAEAMCPARSNDELMSYSLSELNKFQVFAPHGDWTLLDAVAPPKFVFSVFRDPMERILSYYFFLLDKASKMTPAELGLPQHQGLNAVHTMTPDEYFFSGPPHLRNFIDDIYDNFYTHYFAGRTLDGRRRMKAMIRRGIIEESRLLPMALENIAALDARFTIDNLGAVQSLIEAISGKRLSRVYRENVNTRVTAEQRAEALRSRGASESVFELLRQCCVADNLIWAKLSRVGGSA